MNYSYKSAGSLFAALLALAAPRALGQAAPATANPPASSDEETIVLSPFLIESSEDAGSYRASATLAGTRIRTELKDVGSSISVVTQKFLQDTNSKTAEDLLVYTPSTEVAGQGGNFVGRGDGRFLTATNTTSAVANTRVRGLAEADNTRDFYLSDIPWDSYNVGRVDLQRGPNSILFGIGSPAGIVNSSLNAASFRDSNKVEGQFGSYGSLRFSGDFNKVLLKNELALRLSLLDDETKYRQDPAYKHDKRVYVAGKWDPKFLNTEGMHTSIRANYEVGRIRSNMPRITPPIDAITPWFVIGKPTYAARISQQTANVDPWLGAPGNRVYDGVITTFNGSSADMTYAAKIFGFPDTGASAPGAAVGDNVLKGIATWDALASRSSAIFGSASPFPYTDIGAYKARSLTDASVFDFYNNLLEGPNKSEFNDFDAFNVAFTQTFLNDRVGYEIGYDHQHAKWGYKTFIADDGSVVTVDIMSALIDGLPNPNVGRPMVIAGGGSAGGYWQERTRDTLRATVFGELNFADFTDKDSIVARVFGRNVFTGLLQSQKADNESRNYNRYYLADSFLPAAGQGAVGQASRDDIFYVYLGQKITANTASGLGMVGIKDTLTPPSSQTINYYNNSTGTWQYMPLNIVNNDLASDEAKTYRTARKNQDKVKSYAAVWQGYWLDNMVIPMVGIRKDKQTFRDAGNPPSVPNNASGKGGLVNPEDPSWKIPDDVDSLSLTSKTYSLVTHLPANLRRKLPGQLDFGFVYNKSENFRPDAGRRDIRGHPVDNPKGNTTEYGVQISALDDRVTFKWAHYKTKVANATLDSAGIGNQYLIGAVEAWGQAAAMDFRNSMPLGGPTRGRAETLYGISSDGHQVTWRPDGPQQGSREAGFTYTQAQIDATWAREKASVDAWFASQVPADFQNAWALTDYATGGGSTNYGASGLVVTGDTISKGNEFELMVNPVKGLDISINASKTSATRTNIAQSYVDWITTRWAQFQGPAGDMRLWGGDDDSGSGNPSHTGETARGKYGRETMAGYNLFRALEGADVPELKPWAFNATANYSFQPSGFLSQLKGANVGASYRWIDKSVTGFPVITNSSGAHQYDVEHPYHSGTQQYFDFWLGYERKVTQRIKWRIQLNVRNVFASDDLIRVTVNPDGSPAAYRIPEPRTWTVTNTFTF